MAFAVDERLAEGVLAHGPVELFQPYLAQGFVLKEVSAKCSGLARGKYNRFVAVEDAEPDGEAAQVVCFIEAYALSELAVEALGCIGWCKEVKGIESFSIFIFFSLPYS